VSQATLYPCTKFGFGRSEFSLVLASFRTLILIHSPFRAICRISSLYPAVNSSFFSVCHEFHYIRKKTKRGGGATRLLDSTCARVDSFDAVVDFNQYITHSFKDSALLQYAASPVEEEAGVTGREHLQRWGSRRWRKPKAQTTRLNIF
jgi:hypothetical protein